MTAQHLPLPPSVVPPLVTPFSDGDRPDWDGLASQAVWFADRGVGGLWTNGSTGEFHTLSGEERTEAIKAVASAVAGRGLPIIDNVGTTATRLSIKLAEQSMAAGATGLAVVLPYYLHYSEDECMDYLRTVKSAAGGAPIYVYQVPELVRMLASDRMILTLLEEGTIQGMKESWGNMSAFRFLMETVAAKGLELPAFTGDSALLNAFIVSGGVGTITAVALILPRHIRRNLEALQRGDLATATRLQAETVRVVLAMRPPGRPGASRMATIKAILAAQGVISSPRLAAPFDQLAPDDLAYLRDTVIPMIDRLESAAAAA